LQRKEFYETYKGRFTLSGVKQQELEARITKLQLEPEGTLPSEASRLRRSPQTDGL